MASHLRYTSTRNDTVASVRDGKYDDVRIFGLESNSNFAQPWSRPSDALEGGTFLSYSASCWYFAESLRDALGPRKSPPLGLIHVSAAQSSIVDWMDDDALAKCKDVPPRGADNPAGYFDARVAPFADAVTVRGFLWYAGEADMAYDAVLGSYARKSGYACLQVEMVRSWRTRFAATPGTTDIQAPFGIVTLHPTGAMGKPADAGTMRWAQTGGYGVLPNPAMRETFQAQAYDLGDLYSGRECYDAGCCGTDTRRWAYSPVAPGNMCHGEGGGDAKCREICESGRCDGYCSSLAGTNFLAGPEQPRTKRAVGERLAGAAAATAYGNGSPITGPTIAGCKKDGNTLVVRFHKALLAGDVVDVRDYKGGMSKMEVLIDPDHFCAQRSRSDPTRCVDDGYGHEIEGGAVDSSKWMTVDISSDASVDTGGQGSGRNEIIADLSSTGGVAHAVRYAWEGSCCSDDEIAPGTECPTASCPVVGRMSNLPANPFIAKITRLGRCECLHPQTCHMFDEHAPHWHDPLAAKGWKFLAVVAGIAALTLGGVRRWRRRAWEDEEEDYELEKLTGEHARFLTEGFAEVAQEDEDDNDERRPYKDDVDVEGETSRLTNGESSSPDAFHEEDEEEDFDVW
uniref:Sialate O-acetylesterase domain-containing protein n=1 Tax=Odontella aurita TaxID=265563 RepID=A0A7S4JD90_9STRA